MSTDSKIESSSEQIESVQNSQNVSNEHVAIHNETFAINEDALGTNLARNYYYSPGFIGTLVVCPLEVGLLNISSVAYYLSRHFVWAASATT